MPLGKRKRPLLDLGVSFNCPCCFRPGTRFCEAYEPGDAAKKLQGLRSLFGAHEIGAYVVPSGDAHSSEYVSPADERRAYLTGFTGSAGVALVTATEALLWTDSRYFLQAEEQLKGTDWTLMRQYQPGVFELTDWALAHLEGKVVGIDPAMISAEKAEEWQSKWASRVQLKPIALNLVDAIWPTRPEDPCNAVEVHPLELAGEAVDSKLDRVRAAVREAGAAAIVVSALDQIAWLLNLRGGDIMCNPVFFAYALVTEDKALLFARAADEGQAGLSGEVRAHLQSAGVAVRPYRAFFSEAPGALEGRTVFLEPSSCSLGTMSFVPAERRVRGVSPVERFKAVKNEKEIEGLRLASKRDSAALCELLALLEARLAGRGGAAADAGVANGGAAEVTEVAAADLMASLRRRQEKCVGDSFPTISSAGPNSAVCHYQPEPGSCRSLRREEIYLCDTGGQYKDGTTDITRTVHFGEPTAEERRCFTRVAQGHIALASAVFPEGTPGLMLDTLARAPLWRDGLNYGHGTGHGMGAYLNVHEGPVGIGGGSVPGDVISKSDTMKRMYLEPFAAGHFVSDEPGFYKDGEFGIRLESDLLAVPAATHFETGTRQWLRFEYLTLVPICRELLDVSLLDRQELQWLDAYHRRVWEALEGAVPLATREWLQRATCPLA